MNFEFQLLPQGWQFSAEILYSVLTIWIMWQSPWRRLLDSESLHVFLGSTVLLLFVWHIKADAIPGLDYHYLGVTLLTLMLGWQLAYLALNLILLGMLIDGLIAWQGLAINTLLVALLPVLISHAIFTLADRKLPNHFFVYVFINGFFGAALTFTLTILITGSVLILGEVKGYHELASTYFIFLPLMAFPEAFITGLLITIMVVMRPTWVQTFDDHRYLHGK